MAGKFTGLRYDQPAYAEEVERSTNPLMYRLDPNYAVNCKRCFAPYGPRGGHQSADVIGQQVDVDSVLRGVGKVHTKSNQQQLPDCIDGFQTHMPQNCSNALESEYSRYTNPSFDIRGLNTKDLRLGYPLHDPQCQIFENFAVNTKLQAKDDHRATWQIPLNQRDLLPTERLGRVKNCSVSLNCTYAPFNASG